MSEILIQMEMPKDCYTCSFRTTVGRDEWMCMVNKMRFPSWESGWNGDTYRHENCPLVELPPHGDLVDRDEIIEQIAETPFTMSMFQTVEECRAAINAKEVILNVVAYADAVIPSNKERSEDA